MDTIVGSAPSRKEEAKEASKDSKVLERDNSNGARIIMIRATSQRQGGKETPRVAREMAQGPHLVVRVVVARVVNPLSYTTRRSRRLHPFTLKKNFPRL